MNIVICDNNPLYCAWLREKLIKYAASRKIGINITILHSGDELLFGAENGECYYINLDLIYLDINMPRTNGVDTARRLREMGYDADIVFFTKDAGHMLSAFDVKALHYIVKSDTNDEKMEEIFADAAERAESRCRKHIVLSCVGESRRIDISSIRCFEVHKRIVMVHYGEGCTFEFYSSLKNLEAQLPKDEFMRVHASYLVGRRFIIRKTSFIIELDDGEIIPIGRTYFPAVRALELSEGIADCYVKNADHDMAGRAMRWFGEERKLKKLR